VRELREARKLQQDGDAAAYDPAVDDDDDIVITMKLSDMAEFVDTDTYALLTEHFFDYTWDEIMNEHDDLMKSSEEIANNTTFAIVRNGVLKAIGRDLGKIDELDAVITDVERDTLHLIDAIDRLGQHSADQ
jgi:hypothetical protein